MRIWRAVRGEGFKLGTLAQTQCTPQKQHSKGQPRNPRQEQLTTSGEWALPAY